MKCIKCKKEKAVYCPICLIEQFTKAFFKELSKKKKPVKQLDTNLKWPTKRKKLEEKKKA